MIEGDEYGTSYFDLSPKFLGYRAYAVILTSVEMDHTNFFKDFDDYKQAFKFLSRDLPKNGFLICNNKYQAIKEISNVSEAQTYFYGTPNQYRNEETSKSNN